jgi:hypothetical protein
MHCKRCVRPRSRKSRRASKRVACCRKFTSTVSPRHRDSCAPNDDLILLLVIRALPDTQFYLRANFVEAPTCNLHLHFRTGVAYRRRRAGANNHIQSRARARPLVRRCRFGSDVNYNATRFMAEGDKNKIRINFARYSLRPRHHDIRASPPIPRRSCAS